MFSQGKKLLFPLLCLSIFFGLLLLGLGNRKLIDTLRSEGKDYVAVSPVAQPKQPQDGQDGRSAYQIWLDNGYEGSEMDFLTWLRGASGRDGRDGLAINGQDGADGRDGKNGKDGYTPVKGVDYFDGVSIKGDKGDKGDSITGPAGANGRTPELACVIRWDSEIEGVTRYFAAWKYTDETTWKDMYRIPSGQASGMGCTDLRQ